jgi:hypothetical protein
MSAKEIIVKPISKPEADKIVKKYHYSGKVVQNSNLNFGVYYKGLLLGAMQFGSPTDKRKMLPLVKDTLWDGMMELNRMAFSDALPRFAESRAIVMAFKWMKKNAPQIEWVISFADGCQCGHGTIYQASNFQLINIKKNSTIIQLPNGEKTTDVSINTGSDKYGREKKQLGFTSTKKFLDEKYRGWKPLLGYQYKYIYFLNPKAKERFTGQFIPFSKIKELNIEMYKGEWVKDGANK